MNKTELESKHIAELHTLAAESGVEGYRMLRREELIEKLVDGKPSRGGEQRKPRQKREQPREKREGREKREPTREKREGPPRSRRERPPRKPATEAKPPARTEPEVEEKPAPEPVAASATSAATSERPRRRRRFGRRKKTVGAPDLLLPPPGRQALVYGDSRAACSALLLELAAELAGASKGSDPIALLVDPSPEELAGWRREVPQAEIVAAGKARHASDAVAQAVRRAEGGEDVVLLVDSLSRLEDAGVAQEIFDCGTTVTSGSLTVVAALERPS